MFYDQLLGFIIFHEEVSGVIFTEIFSRPNISGVQLITMKVTHIDISEDIYHRLEYFAAGQHF